jgi:hypothetical protein
VELLGGLEAELAELVALEDVTDHRERDAA